MSGVDWSTACAWQGWRSESEALRVERPHVQLPKDYKMLESWLDIRVVAVNNASVGL
jgi:hypothetical protein